MPKYVDAEKLIRDLIDNRSFYPAIVKSAIENAPTEDVVPRSECEQCKEVSFNALKDLQETFAKGIQDVAREIFEELDRLMLDGAIGNKYPAKVINPPKYAELKKKYIGE